MPRPKTMPDEDVLAAALAIIHASGPEGLTFAALATGTGLSASTLVQRFVNKQNLVQRTLLQAWDGLDRLTSELSATLPKTPEGAVDLLVGLSGGYGGIETYADGLRILREDLRDPALRARGARWRDALSQALDERLSGPSGPVPGIGLLMASHWQGALLWWSFDPQIPVADFVRQSLGRFVSVLATGASAPPLLEVLRD